MSSSPSALRASVHNGTVHQPAAEPYELNSITPCSSINKKSCRPPQSKAGNFRMASHSSHQLKSSVTTPLPTMATFRGCEAAWFK
jgi:hypothetical protein